MVFDFTLERSLFLHTTDNPPNGELVVYITLDPTNSTGLLQLDKFGGGYQTEYILRLEHPLQVGFNSADQFDVQKDLQNLVLAMNLTLSRVCTSLSKIEFIKNNVKMKSIPSKPAKIEDDGKGHHTISVKETILLRDEAHIEMGTREKIDEPTTIAIFQRLQQIKRFDITNGSPFTLVNLAKALKEYEDAMNDVDRLTIFKHLYNTIELATNGDGGREKDDQLDQKASQLTGTPADDLRVWRELYNRTKHPDFRPDQVEKYLNGRYSLPTENVKVRACAKAAILARLP